MAKHLPPPVPMLMDVALVFLKAHSGPAHALLAALIMLAAFGALRLLGLASAHWIGAALAIGFYWGREKRDHENLLGRPAAEVWDLGWMPWEWSAKGIDDFVWPATAVLALGSVIQVIGRPGPKRPPRGHASPLTARDAAT